jgi:hypothetical protein
MRSPQDRAETSANARLLPFGPRNSVTSLLGRSLRGRRVVSVCKRTFVDTPADCLVALPRNDLCCGRPAAAPWGARGGDGWVRLTVGILKLGNSEHGDGSDTMRARQPRSHYAIRHLVENSPRSEAQAVVAPSIVSTTRTQSAGRGDGQHVQHLNPHRLPLRSVHQALPPQFEQMEPGRG